MRARPPCGMVSGACVPSAHPGPLPGSRGCWAECLWARGLAGGLLTPWGRALPAPGVPPSGGDHRQPGGCRPQPQLHQGSCWALPQPQPQTLGGGTSGWAPRCWVPGPLGTPRGLSRSWNGPAPTRPHAPGGCAHSNLSGRLLQAPPPPTRTPSPWAGSTALPLLRCPSGSTCPPPSQPHTPKPPSMSF